MVVGENDFLHVRKICLQFARILLYRLRMSSCVEQNAMTISFDQS